MPVDKPTGPVSDADLWLGLRTAEESAFRELFLRHSDAVYNYCFRRTASWSVAEDAVQATFATLWSRAVTGRVDELRHDSARPVLLAMARNECSNATRARSRHLQLVDRIASAPDSGSGDGAARTDNTNNWVEAESTMSAIRAALAVLPSKQRDVVELVAWSELSMADTARVLRISVGTVKSRLARARATLATTTIAALLGES